MGNRGGGRMKTPRDAKAHKAVRMRGTNNGDGWQRSWSREEFRRWLVASCERQGVPVVIRDAATVRAVVALLGGPATVKQARPRSTRATRCP